MANRIAAASFPLRAVALALAAAALPATVGAQEYPRVEIANAELSATLYLPDEDVGYYRGTRFEWGGVFGRLEYGGRNYAARWYEPHDPRRHDSLGGPIQEFVVDGRNNGGLGFDAAAPGETFIKIGVGVLRKPDDRGFSFSREYEIVDHGEWTVSSGPDAVAFVHDLMDPRTGYGYRYSKVVRLADDEPAMVVEHRLRNRGSRPIETSVYNHNFLVMDDRPSGPEITVDFPFDLNVTAASANELLDIAGRRLTFDRALADGESVHYRLDGFGPDAADNDFSVESRSSGTGVRITGDRPLSHFVFWSVPRVISPEAYIQMRIEPEEEFTWTTRYDFYRLR